MGVRFRLSNSVKSPEIKMGRSYEERVSSYRKTFGPEGGQGRVQETREQVQYSSSNLLNSSMEAAELLQLVLVPDVSLVIMPEPSPPALLVRILNKWQMLLAQNSFTKEPTKRKN